MHLLSNWVCYTDNFFYLYFFVSPKSGAYYITGQKGEFRLKNPTLYLTYTFLVLFYCFSSKNLSLYHFDFFFFLCFFDKVSNFRNRILTSQNLEFVKRNFHWNCMSILLGNFGQGFFRHEFFSEIFKKILCISIQRKELWSVRYYSVFAKHVAIKIFRTCDFCFFCRRFPCKLICLFQCGFFGGVFYLPAN